MRKNNNAVAVEILMGYILFAITYTIVFKQTNMPSDYSAHMNWAKDFLMNFPMGLTYPMWHFGVWVCYMIGNLFGNMQINYACAFFTAIVNVAIYLVINGILKKENILYSWAFSFALCVVSPVYIPWYNENLYVGQGSPVTWHNPTNLMTKPFAIVSFVLIVKICDKIRRKEEVAGLDYRRLGLMLFFSALAKPSYFQGIVPALGCYIVISIIVLKNKILPYVKLCVTFIPAFLIIVYQFLINFISGDNANKIGIGFAKSTTGTPNLFVSLLLVILFPFLYTLLNYRKTLKQTQIQLAWIFVVMAWLEAVFLYEDGSRMYDGNFGWALQVAFTVIWIITTKEFVKDWQSESLEKERVGRKNIILAMVWGLHVLCGIYYVQALIEIDGLFM